MIRKETWIVLAVFVAALAGLFLWQRYGKSAEEESAAVEEPAALFDLEAAQLQAMRLERVGDRTVEFERDSAGAWQIAWPENLPGDSAALESTLVQLQSVTGEPMMNAPALADMGLEEPGYRLLLTLQDGRQMVADVGKSTPTGGGYYVLVSDRKVYIVNSFSLDPILGLIDDLPLLPTPTPAEAYPVPEGAEPTEAVPAGTP